MNKATAILLLLAVAGCSSTQQASAPAQPTVPGGSGATVTLSDADRAAIESAVRAKLASNSATFRTIIGQRDANNAVTVCGYVNPGTGDTPFVGSLTGGTFTVIDLGGPTERTIAVQKACHGRGIYI